MRITNNENLPKPLYDAICSISAQYDKGDADFSVTQLQNPPQMEYLKRQHADELEEDASDRIWSLMGTITHKILEEADGHAGDHQELRLYMDVLGKTVSGQMDYWTGGYIFDWKLMSVWETMNGLKPEKAAQLNCYAELARRNGMEVKALGIVSILRDWSKTRAARERDNGYPQRQVQIHRVDLWTVPTVNEYLEERVRLHTAEPRPCTLDEQWSDGETWAVHKKGQKRAVKLFRGSEHGVHAKASAQAWLNAQGDKGQLVLQGRQEEKKRCEHYCPVKNFCPQYAKEVRG